MTSRSERRTEPCRVSGPLRLPSISRRLVEGRDSEYALALMDELCGRLANRVQLTSDGHRAYLEAVEVRLERTWTMPNS